jgi:hypothetical protein
MSSLLCAGQAPRTAAVLQGEGHVLPQRQAQLVQIGVRSYPDGSHLPIWALMLGDTANAEQVASRYRGLGPYSLNATLWTRAEDGPTWVMTTFRRPVTIDEAVDLHNNREAFTSRRQGDRSLLPPAFARLKADLIDNVDFIIQYDDGSAKAYLYPGTSRSDAEDTTAAVGSLMR